jgi:hypothetical protein
MKCAIQSQYILFDAPPFGLFAFDIFPEGHPKPLFYPLLVSSVILSLLSYLSLPGHRVCVPQNVDLPVLILTVISSLLGKLPKY